MNCLSVLCFFYGWYVVVVVFVVMFVGFGSVYMFSVFVELL